MEQLHLHAVGLGFDWGSLRKSRVEHAERETLDIGQARRLLAWCDANPCETAGGVSAREWGAWVRVLYHTGLRPVDAVSLSRSEIVGGMVELMPEKTSRTRRKVSFAASPALLRVLEALEPDGDGRFFPALRDLYSRSRKNIPHHFARLCTLAGAEGVTPYSFRHHFVTRQIDSGASMEDVAAAVGHSETSTTEAHYYHGRRGVELNEMPEI